MKPWVEAEQEQRNDPQYGAGFKSLYEVTIRWDEKNDRAVQQPSTSRSRK